MVKIGVVGCGHIGKIHIEQLKQISEVSLIGVLDKRIETAKTVSIQFGIPFCSNLEELLQITEAIIIATDSDSHFEIAQQCIKAGKHVFIEKPLTLDISQALELVHMSKESNVYCMVGHVERFNIAYTSVKRLILNPLFIESHRLASFSSKLATESVVLDLMIHDIDIVLSLVKSEINRISATGVKVISDSIDIANARIEFSNGCIANLTASRISQYAMRKTRVFQQDKYFNIDFLHRESEVVELIDANHAKYNPDLQVIQVANQATKYLYIEQWKNLENNAILDEMKNFVESIQMRKTPIISAEVAYTSMQVADKILKKIYSLND
jgi:predicted dehydrogenase